METLLTIQEVSERLRVSVRWLRNEIANGGFPHHRIGARQHMLRFRMSEIEAWLTRGEEGAAHSSSTDSAALRESRDG